jgi:hypothetical protein
MPDRPPALAAAHFVALISDLPAEWIDDCARQRRQPVTQPDAAAASPSTGAGGS